MNYTTFDKNNWEENFHNPPMQYRSAPLWVWNDEMTEQAICEQLEDLQRHGFGGAFVHPRPGMVTPYLSDEWFALWGIALKKAKQLGMKLNIYDENSYPSGFAGGQVSAELPDCLATSVKLQCFRREELLVKQENKEGIFAEDQKNSLVRAYTYQKNEGIFHILQDITEEPVGHWEALGTDFCILEIETAQTRPWLGGFAYVDLLRPEVTEHFLKATHEKYYEKFGHEFGKTILSVFSDEPYITGSKIYSDGRHDTIPFSFWFAFEFQKINGYSILEHLPALFFQTESELFQIEDRKVRYDYYSTMRKLWTENFIKPMAKWCQEHSIAMTGHFMEHEWPLASGGSPSVMQNYAYMDWPGIDMLMTTILKQEPAHMLLMTILEVRSVANQLLKERTLCEIYGAGGWDSTFEDYKRIGDWVLVNGINLLNQHLVYSSVTGSRKRDHPQSFDWREPWWEEYTELNLYQGRISFALSQGNMEQRILLIHPTQTGYLVPREGEAGHLMNEVMPTEPNMEEYLETIQKLTDGQWDFDLGDEEIIKRHGIIDQYQILLLSGNMKTMTQSTYETLYAFLKRGGIVIGIGMPGPYIEGREKKEQYESLFQMPSYIKCRDDRQMEEALRNYITPRIQGKQNFPRGFSHMRRRMDSDHVVYFLVNQSMDLYEDKLSIQGSHAIVYDGFSGTAKEIQYNRQGTNIEIHIRLYRNQSLLLMVEENNRTGKQSTENDRSAAETGGERKKETLICKEIRPMNENTLVIDYCDLWIDHREYNGIPTGKACDILFEKRGFGKNPWEDAVQYKRRILDRNGYAAQSGFTVKYYVYAKEITFLENIKVAVERNTFYTLHVNGIPVGWSSETWMDRHIGVADIKECMQAGENVIELQAEKFDVLLELDAIYLLGKFGVYDIQGRWTIGQESVLKEGFWKEQGYPFYAGGMSYRYAVKRKAEHVKWDLHLPHWNAAACSLLLNGKKISLTQLGDCSIVELTELVSADKEEIELLVFGSLKNVFGPFHNVEKPRGNAWPKLWKNPPQKLPAAKDYDLIGYGITESLFIETYEERGENRC